MKVHVHLIDKTILTLDENYDQVGVSELIRKFNLNGDLMAVISSARTHYLVKTNIIRFEVG